MTTGYTLFDASKYLDSDEMIAEYLTACAEDENPDVLLLALANVAKARGMANVAKTAGLSRESLYKTLAPGAHPRFETIQAVLRALNVTIAVRPPAPTTKHAAKKLKPPRRAPPKTLKPKSSSTAAEESARKAAGRKAAIAKAAMAKRAAATKRPTPARKRG
jgi:probable addiction module antidote protein